MRTLVTALCGALALAGSASASNIAGLGIVTTSSFLGPIGPYTFIAANSVDGTTVTEWVAPGTNSPPTVEPWLLISLPQQYTIDSITVDGIGNQGLFTAFDIFVGTLAALQNIETNGAGSAGVGATLVMNIPNQADGTAWSIARAVPGGIVQTQYVLYEAIDDTTNNANCPGNTCFPGSAFFSSGTPTSGQDDAFVTEIVVNAVPEPISLGLVSGALLALGFAKRRFRK